MKKRIICILLVLVLTAALFPAGAFAAADPALLESVQIGGFRFNYYQGDILVVEGSGRLWLQFWSSDVVRMASTAKTIEIGKGITAVDGAIFGTSPAVEELKLPDTLTEIGSCFKDCSHLKSVEIPDSVKSITADSFRNCSALESVKLSVNVDTIFPYCFSGCTSLKTIYPTKQLTMISEEAFSGCTSLESFDMPNVTNLGRYAFGGCTKLNSVNIGSHLDYVGGDVFLGTPYYTDPANWDNGLFYVGNVLVKADKSVTSCEVRKGTTAISDNAFSSCEGFKEVTLPQGLKSIGRYAFGGAEFESIDIPDSVNRIEPYAFSGCANLKSVTLPAKLKILNANVFYACTSLTEAVIPEGVTSVDLCAFSECSNIRRIVLPATLEDLQNPRYVFDDIEYVFCGTERDWNGVPNPDQHEKLSSLIVYHSHSWGDWQVGQAAGCTEKGFDVAYCSECGSSRVRDIAAAGHCFENRVCTRCGMPAPNPFTDIKENDIWFNSVMWAYYSEPRITAGFTETEFRPTAPCNRGQVVTFLWRALDCPVPMSVSCRFTDVSASSPYYNAIIWAADEKVTTGFDETHFRPGQTVTRAQFVTFLWRAMGCPQPESMENPFVDVSETSPYYTAILWAAESGVTNGYGNNDFRPNATCSRWQVVEFMFRALGDK